MAIKRVPITVNMPVGLIEYIKTEANLNCISNSQMFEGLVLNGAAIGHMAQVSKEQNDLDAQGVLAEMQNFIFADIESVSQTTYELKNKTKLVPGQDVIRELRKLMRQTKSISTGYQVHPGLDQLIQNEAKLAGCKARSVYLLMLERSILGSHARQYIGAGFTEKHANILDLTNDITFSFKIGRSGEWEPVLGRVVKVEPFQQQQGGGISR